MSVAARSMGWQRRMRGAPGPFAAPGEPSNGNPVTVELFIDGVWTDITSYVMTRDGSQKIEITRGKSDESANVERSTCSFELNNRDGRFSPRNPTGVYYGKIGRNTPLRVSVPDNTGKNYRFWGECTKWPQEWDLTGTDFWVNMEAYGVLSRLEKGRVPTHSVLYNLFTGGTVPSLLTYWPCEDLDGATSIAAPLAGTTPMTITGTPDLASFTRFGSSDPLPTMGGTYFAGPIAVYSPVTSLQVRFLLFVPEIGLDDGQVIAAVKFPGDVNTTVTYELYYNAGGTVTLRALDGDGATLGAELGPVGAINGKYLRVSLEFAQNGTGISRTIRLLETNQTDDVNTTDTQAVSTLERAIRVEMAPAQVLGPATAGMTDTAVGHVTVQNAVTSITDIGAQLDPSGEAAGRRFERVCAERNLGFNSIGDLDTTARMGPQEKAKPLDHFQECEEADGGMMYENLSVFGLGYRTRASMYNQDPALTLSYSDNILSEVPLPVEDDRFIRNSVDVTRSASGGATYHKELETGALSVTEPPQGVGEYGDSTTVNVEFDTDLPDQAGWRLRHGTLDEARYPQISFNLARQQITTQLRSAILGVRSGDRILVTDPPVTQAPDDISLLVLGWSKETIDNFQHTVTFNCATETPWHVATADSATFGRADTAGSVLISDITSTSTELTVETTSGPWWTTDSDEFPFDIRMGGEVMTVTGITFSIYDTFTRTESSTWGTADTGQTWSQEGGAASDYSVSTGKGRHLLTSVSISRRNFITTPTDDFDITCKVTADALSTGDYQFAGITARYADVDNLYHARIAYATSNVVVTDIVRRVGGVETSLGTSFTSGITHVAGQELYLRFQGIGARLKSKIWLVTDREPVEWNSETVDSTFYSGSCGVKTVLGGSNTNVNPTFAYDEFSFNNRQTFTVTRSVNGVVKSHSAGSTLSLDQPAIAAL